VFTLRRRSLVVVGGAAFIYAAIVGMWALVLIPMWLRRHDEQKSSKSADRFAKAMGTLRRSDAGAVSPGSREVMMPRRPASTRASEVVVSGDAGRLSPAAQAAQRRRRVLMGLVGLLFVTTVVVLLGAAPVWVMVLPTLLVGGFLVAARRQVALAADLARRRERRATLAEAARAADARYAGEGIARRGGRAVDPAPAPASPASASAPVQVQASGDGLQAASGSWNAVPTTLPTYVTAPRATRMPRVIDLTTPGSWNGAAMMEQARASLAPEPVDEGGMRVETFEITVPHDPAVRAGVVVEPSSYADRFVEDPDDLSALAEDDSLEALLEDPRTGVDLPPYRRAANS
jgi:hypothetical protein